MTESSEVRFPPVSREQRDCVSSAAYWLHQADHDDLAGPLRALVAAWDAAVPGVVDASWADLTAALEGILDYFYDPPEDEGFEYHACYLPRVIAEEALRRSAGGERPSVSLRETIETHLRAKGWKLVGRDYWRSPFDGHSRLLGEAVAAQIRHDKQEIKYAQVEREAEEGERDE